ncbi:DNA-binding protein SMUBP-2 [Ctenocephalides felis]|uniref:DNA-binding protein SMUBP-2 n=1 Tax=Ctenocephalides felis TaxID=7515 RepID=UPI000E6E4D7F|nr:DNA-binding protein SMUBP-2 [Ctenocephalides felis]
MDEKKSKQASSKSGTSTDSIIVNGIKDVHKTVESITKKDDLNVNLDGILEEVKKIDNTCVFKTCKTKTDLMGANCPHCTLRFCFKHSLPEIHGCGEAAKRDERRKWLHPTEKLAESKKEEVKGKLDRKLKEMQQARKSKQYKTKNK